jgi:hypothetical protein
LMWLRIGTGGRLLWMRQRTFGFHKTQGIFWLADDLLTSQEGLCSIELVRSYVVISNSVCSTIIVFVNTFYNYVVTSMLSIGTLVLGFCVVLYSVSKWTVQRWIYIYSFIHLLTFQ